MNEIFLESSVASKGLISTILLAAFFIGSIPFSLAVARILKIKGFLIEKGKSFGVPEISKIAGFWPLGFIVLSLDLLKGSLAVLLSAPIGYHLFEFIYPIPLNNSVTGLNITTMWAAGFIAVLGNCYSPWTHFKGNKGVSTTFGALLVLSPVAAFFGGLGFFLTFFYKKTVSLSSISGLCLAAIAYMVFNSVGVHLWFGAALLFLVLMKHEANIDALLENREELYN